ncbi:MAG: hypothetical protein JXA89_25385 [Anaerolineae bacterium]|nr:hypothetical protein [Anaerolineae bacterium]
MNRAESGADANVDAHVVEIERCNQRGGRMLSLVDLLNAGSVDLPLAAYLAAAMRSGASLLVGARPGGAGKTAVMCALLNFLPDRTAIQPVADQAALACGLRDPQFGDRCYLAHEIGAGYYYAYVWGKEARAFFQLASNGHIIASNLHADTLQETHDQLVGENGVARAHLDAVRLKIYLRVARGQGWSMRRWVSRVYESDGEHDRLLWERVGDGTFHQAAGSAIVSPEQEAHYAAFLATLEAQDRRTIEQVRRALLKGQS